MFEQLFTYPGVLSRHQEAPWVQERERYLVARAAVGVGTRDTQAFGTRPADHRPGA